jgi:hypothetical protein
MGVSIGEQMAKLDVDDPATRPSNWASVLDQLLVGVTHAISNRVATLAGVSDILSGDPTIPPILRALADEVPRLEEGIRLLRLLAIPEDERTEALEATRAVEDAISLAQLHPACRNSSFVIDDKASVPPVIARPTALTHELVVALVEAAMGNGTLAEGAVDDGGQARISILFASEGEDLVITVASSAVRARLLTAGRG